jgi:hypothetical protein
MDPLEINKIITEHCGLRYHKPTEEEVKSGSYYQFEPNYYGDLNLMHQAEYKLTDEQQVLYNCYIENAVKASSHFKGRKGFHHVLFQFRHVEPRIKAECYVKAIGKWTGELGVFICENCIMLPTWETNGFLYCGCSRWTFSDKKLVLVDRFINRKLV